MIAERDGKRSLRDGFFRRAVGDAGQRRVKIGGGNQHAFPAAAQERADLGNRFADVGLLFVWMDVNRFHCSQWAGGWVRSARGEGFMRFADKGRKVWDRFFAALLKIT